MVRFIKYERFEKSLTIEELQNFFDDLISDGWEIITYNELNRIKISESNFSNDKIKIHFIIVVGKKQNNVL